MRILLALKQARLSFLKSRFDVLKRETEELNEQYSALQERIRRTLESGADPEVILFPQEEKVKQEDEIPNGHAR